MHSFKVNRTIAIALSVLQKFQLVSGFSCNGNKLAELQSLDNSLYRERTATVSYTSLLKMLFPPLFFFIEIG